MNYGLVHLEVVANRGNRVSGPCTIRFYFRSFPASEETVKDLLQSVMGNHQRKERHRFPLKNHLFLSTLSGSVYPPAGGEMNPQSAVLCKLIFIAFCFRLVRQQGAMNIVYPVITQDEVIDLFHVILYWRYTDKKARGQSPCYWCTTFDLVSKVLTRADVLHERRIRTLCASREFFQRFIKRTAVVEQTNNSPWETILAREKRRPFAVKISPREQVNGNWVEQKDLFALRKIFITARGAAVGPIVEKAVAKFLTRANYEKVWEEMTAIPVPGIAMAVRNRRYAAWLEGEEKI